MSAEESERRSHRKTLLSERASVHSRLEMPSVDRVDSKRLPGPGDEPRAIERQNRRADCARPRLPTEHCAFADWAVKRYRLDLGVARATARSPSAPPRPTRPVRGSLSSAEEATGAPPAIVGSFAPVCVVIGTPFPWQGRGAGVHREADGARFTKGRRSRTWLRARSVPFAQQRCEEEASECERSAREGMATHQEQRS